MKLLSIIRNFLNPPKPEINFEAFTWSYNAEYYRQKMLRRMGINAKKYGRI